MSTVYVLRKSIWSSLGGYGILLYSALFYYNQDELVTQLFSAALGIIDGTYPPKEEEPDEETPETGTTYTVRIGDGMRP